MDEMTQQNASLVEQAAAASESMGAQSDELKSLVNFFDVGVESGVKKVAGNTPRTRKIAAKATEEKPKKKIPLKQEKVEKKPEEKKAPEKPPEKLQKLAESEDDDWEEF